MEDIHFLHCSETTDIGLKDTAWQVPSVKKHYSGAHLLCWIFFVEVANQTYRQKGTHLWAGKNLSNFMWLCCTVSSSKLLPDGLKCKCCVRLTHPKFQFNLFQYRFQLLACAMKIWGKPHKKSLKIIDDLGWKRDIKDHLVPAPCHSKVADC